ncbi:hypothetical protein PFY12_03075 [Chryseobacterium camelliae]|uniref:PH domain-containing protein n=1 Tax=Chryseobacterium camelliae TaxID=1265445 RepID=A0ABY7QN74_9FLAO|nr:hypothetical protein [Chryseobacterium camelliae]WBV61110.1 hypothetical protein PFY12_03075 [Chryseobacterium camelliae]
MKEYNITIFGKKRILLSLFLAPIFFIISIFIGAEFNSLIFPFLFLIIIFFIIYYFVVGNLKIKINDKNELFFEWDKKIIFNYKPIDPIRIDSIKTIILDEGNLLRKIKTDTHIIHINNAKIMTKDADAFISKLKNDANKFDIKIIDSWDELAEKGYLKIAYVLNSWLLILSILLSIFFTILRGFNPFSLSVLLLFIPQMILYNKQMKKKI